jgi:hypothetical protein
VYHVKHAWTFALNAFYTRGAKTIQYHNFTFFSKIKKVKAQLEQKRIKVLRNEFEDTLLNWSGLGVHPKVTGHCNTRPGQQFLVQFLVLSFLLFFFFLFSFLLFFLYLLYVFISSIYVFITDLRRIIIDAVDGTIEINNNLQISGTLESFAFLEKSEMIYGV